MPDASTQTRRGKKIVLLKKKQQKKEWELTREKAVLSLTDAHVELVKKYRKLKAEVEAKKMLQSCDNYDLRTKISEWMSDPKTQGDSIYDFLCDECGCKIDQSNWDDEY